MENGYSLCLNEWALDKTIKNELGLLLIISSLCAEKGYCYASNSYLAKLFNITEQSVSNKIKKLEGIGYLIVDYKYRGTEIINREIRIKNIYTDHIKKIIPTIEKNVKDNNISNNNKNNNIYNMGKQNIINEIIEFMNTVGITKKYDWKHQIKFNYKSTSKATQKIIGARLNEGYSKDDLLDVVFETYYCYVENEFTGFNGKPSSIYFNPTTIFTSEKVQKYKNEYDLRVKNGK